MDTDDLINAMESYELTQDPPIRELSSMSWNFPVDGPALAVNIVGPNGAGKSVWPKMLNCLDPNKYWVVNEEGKKILTVYPTFGWGSVGIYRTKCGGADVLKKNEIMEAIYRLALSGLHFVVEGSIVSHTKYTYWDVFRGINERFQSVQPRKTMFILMDYPLETYLNRINHRNGGKQIDMDCMTKKNVNIKSYMDFYRSDAEASGIHVHTESSEGLKNLINSLMKAMSEVLGVKRLLPQVIDNGRI